MVAEKTMQNFRGLLFFAARCRVVFCAHTVGQAVEVFLQ